MPRKPLDEADLMLKALDRRNEFSHKQMADHGLEQGVSTGHADEAARCRLLYGTD